MFLRHPTRVFGWKLVTSVGNLVYNNLLKDTYIRDLLTTYFYRGEITQLLGPDSFTSADSTER